MSKIEEWRPVIGFPAYEVSCLGQIRRVWAGRRTRPGRILNPSLNSNGYPGVSLYRNRKKYNRSVHRLVAETFLGPAPSPNHEVAHNDGNPGNPVATNLRWTTKVDNLADKIRHGTTNRGERNGLSKLTEKKVLEARARHNNGESIRQLAKIYGVARSTMGNALKGVKWGWLTD